MKNLDPDILQRIKENLIEVYNPISIFLFGSQAWGNPSPDSDLDIAVIVKQSDEAPYLRSQKGTLSLWDIALPIDIIVYTEAEYKSQLHYKSSLQYKIEREGIKLYEAA